MLAVARVDAHHYVGGLDSSCPDMWSDKLAHGPLPQVDVKAGCQLPYRLAAAAVTYSAGAGSVISFVIVFELKGVSNRLFAITRLFSVQAGDGGSSSRWRVASRVTLIPTSSIVHQATADSLIHMVDTSPRRSPFR